MARRFTLDVAGETVTAELLESEAPNVTRAFVECLPIQAFAVHAKFAGDELIAMVPFYTDPENEVFDVRPGDIGYYPGRQTICVFYGETEPFGHVSLFARVVDGLGRLPRVGRRVLRKGPARVSLRSASIRQRSRRQG